MISEGPPIVYVVILRAPWMFPHQPGIAGYRREQHGDPRPVCLVTGARIDRDPNQGEVAEAEEQTDG